MRLFTIYLEIQIVLKKSGVAIFVTIKRLKLFINTTRKILLNVFKYAHLSSKVSLLSMVKNINYMQIDKELKSIVFLLACVRN